MRAIVGSNRPTGGVRRRRHQHPVLHQRDSGGPLRAAAAHADIGSKAKSVLCHHVHPRQRVQRPDGVGVRHLAKGFRGQALHGSWNLAGVGCASSEGNPAHFSLGQGVPLVIKSNCPWRRRPSCGWKLSCASKTPCHIKPTRIANETERRQKRSQTMLQICITQSPQSIPQRGYFKSI